MQLMQRITAEDNLYAAWRAVRANRGGPGTDAVSLDQYEANLAANLDTLRRRLREETYVPLPLRRATMPKRGGGERELAIPTIGDRVAQRAFVQVLEGVFEPVFLPCSFSYRPGLGVAQAIAAVLEHRSAGLPWVLDADVQDFFPSVDHGLLLAALRQRISDRAVLRVIGLWLEAGVMNEARAARPSLLTLASRQVRSAAEAALGASPHGEPYPRNWHDPDDELGDADYTNAPASREMPSLLLRFGAEAARLAWDNRRRLLPLLATKGVLAGSGIGVAVLGAAAVGQHVLAGRTPRGTGTPQGGPISPLLSNIYLHTFDVRMTAAGLRLVRYADDFVVCCASEARARQAQEIAAAELARLRLALSRGKTRIVSCGDALRFLGYEFDQDGAFPVPDRVASPMNQALRRGAEVAGPVVKKAAEVAGRAAHRGTEAGRTGAGAIRQGGAAVAKDIGARWREIRPGKE